MFFGKRLRRRFDDDPVLDLPVSIPDRPLERVVEFFEAFVDERREALGGVPVVGVAARVLKLVEINTAR